MIDFDRIRFVLFDFDDTLAVHTDHIWNEDRLYNNFISAATGKLYEARTLRVSYDMQKFVALCTGRDVRFGLISATGFAPLVEQKIKWVEEHYGVRMQNYCVGRPEEKVMAIKVVKQIRRLDADNILLVDDYYMVRSAADKLGIQVASPAEVSLFLMDNGYV